MGEAKTYSEQLKNRIAQMKKQGFSNEEIYSTLTSKKEKIKIPNNWRNRLVRFVTKWF
ncbi:hypothetical protein ACLBXI_28155 [Bacillus cereus]